MKRILIISLAALMLFTSCSEREGSSSTPSSSEASQSSSVSSEALQSSTESESSSAPESSEPDMPVDLPRTEPIPPSMSVDLDSLSTFSEEPVPWGPGVHKHENGQPLACVDLQEKYGDFDAYFLAGEDNKIYLTFDEGYENGYTDDILDILAEKQVSAVFFVTLPYAKGQPEIINRMINEGHIIGNHSTDHPNYTEISSEEAAADISEIHYYMMEEYGYTMSLFRYPTGAFSEQTLELLMQMGYKTFFWSFAYADWDVNEQPDLTTALDKMTDNLHNGAIYLLHAVSETNALVLGDFIDYAREHGYEFAYGYDALS